MPAKVLAVAPARWLTHQRPRARTLEVTTGPRGRCSLFPFLLPCWPLGQVHAHHVSRVTDQEWEEGGKTLLPAPLCQCTTAGPKSRVSFSPAEQRISAKLTGLSCVGFSLSNLSAGAEQASQACQARDDRSIDILHVGGGKHELSSGSLTQL